MFCYMELTSIKRLKKSSKNFFWVQIASHLTLWKWHREVTSLKWSNFTMFWRIKWVNTWKSVLAHRKFSDKRSNKWDKDRNHWPHSLSKDTNTYSPPEPVTSLYTTAWSYTANDNREIWSSIKIGLLWPRNQKVLKTF